MSDDVENLIETISGDLQTPGVERIHEIAASRQHKRQTTMRVSAVALVAFLIAGVGLWALRPEPTELATANDSSAASIAESTGIDPAPAYEPAIAVPDDEPVESSTTTTAPTTTAAPTTTTTTSAQFFSEDQLISLPEEEAGALAEAAGRTWRVVSRDGEELAITFDLFPGRLNLSVVDGIVVDVQVEGGPLPTTPVTSTPIAPTTIAPTAAAPTTPSSTPQTTIPVETTTSTSTTTTAAPTTTVAPTTTTAAPTPTTSTTTAPPIVTQPGPYTGLSVEDAGANADANGVPWRVVRVDGVDAIITLEIFPGRLNFFVENGIVVSVQIEGQIEPYVSLLVQDAGANADANNVPWRVVRVDGVDLAVTEDFVLGRVNFTVVDGVVVSVFTELGFSPYIGLPVEQAGAELDAAGKPWRVIREDGVDLAITEDLIPGRWNFTVENGIIVNAEIEG